MLQEKKCTKCRETKLLTEYHKDKSKKLGISSWCKCCTSFHGKGRYENKIVNSGGHYQPQKKLRSEITTRESTLAQRAEYRALHKVKIAERRKNSRIRDKIMQTQWRKDNPDKIAAKEARYQTKKTLAGGSYTDEDIAQKKILQSGKCVYCETSILKKNHKDHLCAIENNGTSWPRNIQICCIYCNESKGDKLHSEYLKYRELLGVPTRGYAYTVLDVESTDEYKYHRWLLGEIETPDTMFDASVLYKN